MIEITQSEASYLQGKPDKIKPFELAFFRCWVTLSRKLGFRGFEDKQRFKKVFMQGYNSSIFLQEQELVMFKQGQDPEDKKGKIVLPEKKKLYTGKV